MAVIRRPGSPHLWVAFEYRGRRINRSTKTSNRRLAQQLESKWRQDVITEAEFGSLVPMTVKDACAGYFTERVLTRRATNMEKTIDAAQSRLKAIGRVFGEETPLAQLTAPLIASWKKRMLEDGLAPATVNRNLEVLRAILNMAKKEWNVIREVPHLALIRGVKNGRTRYLDPFSDEEDRLLAACRSDPDFCDFVLFLLDTGGRRGDATQLEWADVQWKANTVFFHHTKTDKNRHVPLPQRCRKMLERRFSQKTGTKVFPYDRNSGQREGDPAPTYAPRRRDDGTTPGVYPREDGKGWCAYVKVKGKKRHLGSFATEQEAVAARLTSEARYRGPAGAAIDSAWKRVMDETKIPDFKIHDLRHCYATKLAVRGTTLHEIGTLLGHQNPIMTLRYAHLIPDVLQSCVDQLDARVDASRFLRGPAAALPTHPVAHAG